MSHLKERQEKTCLNCNAVVLGRFCHVCGQENIEPREKFRHMLAHFVFDLFHFDGKFFSTMKALLLKPGFLSQEHLRGRRADYLHPIRLYIFTSAFFFLFFFAVKTDKIEDKKPVNTADSIRNNDFVNFKQSYSGIREYDSLQAKLPKDKRDGYFIKKMTQRNLELKEKYPNGSDMKSKLFDVFTHQFPKLLFVSLPIFAFILFILYARKSKYFYADHIVYTLHLYAAFFIILFLIICLNMFFTTIGLYTYKADKDINYLNGFISSGFAALLLMFYWYKSLRKFYNQSRAKTFLKFFLLLLTNTFVFAILFLIFIFFSFLIV